ncbi:hypothetical protein CH063_04006, partial [Colletotrichum higginsianum]
IFLSIHARVGQFLLHHVHAVQSTPSRVLLSLSLAPLDGGVQIPGRRHILRYRCTHTHTHSLSHSARHRSRSASQEGGKETGGSA